MTTWEHGSDTSPTERQRRRLVRDWLRARTMEMDGQRLRRLFEAEAQKEGIDLISEVRGRKGHQHIAELDEEMSG